MSQTEFAAAIRDAGKALGRHNGCTKRLVQKWESGEHTLCRPNYRQALERVTRKPYAALGFADSTHGSQPHMTICDSPRSIDMTPSTAPLRGDASANLRYALTRPEVATSEVVDIVADRTAQLFALEQHTSARVILPMVEQHICDVAALLMGTQRKPLRSRLANVGGRSAALAGWLAFDLGDTGTAHHYWDSATACARQTVDAPLFACVLIHLSYSAAERGDHNAAWQLAHAALTHVGDNPRAHAWAAVRAAQEAAHLGDAGAALAELEPALDLVKELDPADPQDDAEPWCRFVDRSYIHAIAANVYTRIGDTESAYASAVRALDSLSTGQTKTRALVLAEAAHAFARIGGTDRANQCSAEAASLADNLESSGTNPSLGSLTSCFRGALVQHSIN